jgi:hypothetical protein
VFYAPDLNLLVFRVLWWISGRQPPLEPLFGGRGVWTEACTAGCSAQGFRDIHKQSDGNASAWRVIPYGFRSDSREFLSACVSEHGLTGLQVGRVVLDGVRNNDFWISTHPAMQADAVARRTQMLADRNAPERVVIASLEVR